ncbi:hypothetical protein BDY17DRAFT_141064 [Neohortaea acidophila]|uniref:P-loop containing nucleoside triphosphate hydrolase protein n=1 Tax=Neohortaea acidophila TaxID=245834 RepID=A0A6A6PSK2_9PEZI|nr:uncharacterized protein BDY17DRAFT_141064 [Neohortaea acidophila]KAF2483080.1 hypothetical protein BDY17DRAFT_141064 [Neohortaea acidophila]
MQAALDQLGYKCWHSTLCFGDNAQCRRWGAAMEGKYANNTPPTRADFDVLFQGYNAVSADPPAFAFVEELVASYPNAKIILVERDEDAWYNSYAATTQHALFRWDMHFVSNIDPDVVGPVRDMQQAWVRLWWKCKTEAEMSAKARTMFREHNRLVRAVVPADRLLVYKLGSGWAPLCEFLEKEAPETPFPSLHDRATVRARYKWINVRGLQIVAKQATKLLVPVGVGVWGWWAYTKYYLRRP